MALTGGLAMLAFAWIGAMAAFVPVRNAVRLPILTGNQTHRHWPVAAASLAIVVVVDVLTVAATVRHRRRESAVTALDPDDGPLARGSRPLGRQRIGRRVVAWTTAVSVGVAAAGFYFGAPAWAIALWVMMTWFPVFVVEEIARYERYGFYAIFVGLAVLQVGHLGEHGAQMTQLLMTNGDLSRSHGVFGQLDFETVHFVWDTVIWLASGLLVYKLWHLRWLWISWVAASIHEVEHVYLWWNNRFHPWFWAHGGIAGIFGQGGLIGSPLARPYLHFGYNFVVVGTMLVALWDETNRVREGHGMPAEWPVDWGIEPERVLVAHEPEVAGTAVRA